MGCGTTTVKICSIVFNVIFAILVIAEVVYFATHPVFESQAVEICAYVLCALVLLFCVLGCVAALRESVCLAASCAVFLLILAILQIATTLVAYNENNDLNGTDTAVKAWDAGKMDELQQKYECCGKDSMNDYVMAGIKIPKSCHQDPKSESNNDLFVAGCSAKIQEFFDEEAHLLLIGSGILVGFEILGFLLAVFLVINFRNKQRRMQF